VFVAHICMCTLQTRFRIRVSDLKILYDRVILCYRRCIVFPSYAINIPVQFHVHKCILIILPNESSHSPETSAFPIITIIFSLM